VVLRAFARKSPRSGVKVRLKTESFRVVATGSKRSKAKFTQPFSLPHSTPSRPREFHPEPLTDPCLTVSPSHGSCHPLRAAAPPPKTGRAPPVFQLAHYGSSVDDPPPSLHGTLLRFITTTRWSRHLTAAFVLSLSWFNPLAAFSVSKRRQVSHVPYAPPLPGSAHLYAGCRPARKQGSVGTGPAIF